MNGSPDNDRDQLRSKLAELAARGVFIGTSSWKYPGWLGQVYARDRGGEAPRIFAREQPLRRKCARDDPGDD